MYIGTGKRENGITSKDVIWIGILFHIHNTGKSILYDRFVLHGMWTVILTLSLQHFSKFVSFSELIVKTSFTESISSFLIACCSRSTLFWNINDNEWQERNQPCSHSMKLWLHSAHKATSLHYNISSRRPGRIRVRGRFRGKLHPGLWQNHIW